MSQPSIVDGDRIFLPSVDFHGGEAVWELYGDCQLPLASSEYEKVMWNHDGRKYRCIQVDHVRWLWVLVP